MLRVDDGLPSHPKILKAGDMLGGSKKNGPALAYAMYLVGLSFARRFSTNGKVPDEFLCSCVAFASPAEVARALANRRVKLWTRIRDGYRIHDYHDYNPSASEIKRLRAEQRATWRRQKRAQRNGKHGK